MNWYLAKIIFRIVCGEGHHTPQFEEQLRLIAAENNEQAFCKARAFGEQEACCFANHQQKMVEWKFINVTELYRLTEMIDGAELYSRIEEADDAEVYMQLANERASFTREHNANNYLQLI